MSRKLENGTPKFCCSPGWSAYVKQAEGRFRDVLSDTEADARCAEMFDPEIEAHAALMKACAAEQCGAFLQEVEQQTLQLRSCRAELARSLQDLYRDLEELEQALAAL